MITKEIVARTRIEIGDHVPPYRYPDPLLIEWINETQQRLPQEVITEKLLSITSSANPGTRVTATQNSYATPTGYLDMVSVEVTTGGSTYPCQEIAPEQTPYVAQHSYLGGDKYESRWAVFKNQLHIYPNVTTVWDLSVSDITCRYWKRPTDLTVAGIATTTQIPDLASEFHELLVLGASKFGFLADGREDRAARADASLRERLQVMNALKAHQVVGGVKSQ